MLQYKIADRLIPAGEGDTAQVVVLERADQGPCVLPSGMELSSLPAGEAAWTPRLTFGAGYVSGSLVLAQREKGEAGPRISFGLWPKGLLLLDESGAASQILSNMADHAIWKHPASPAQVFCRLLEGLADGDGALLREAESSLEALEEDVLGEKLDGLSERMLPLRKQIGRLLLQYGRLSDLGEQLAQAGDAYFTKTEALAFQGFGNRAARLEDQAEHLREYAAQIWETYQAAIDIRQNRVMQLLTVVATIFMPLTLITGWYGMNFPDMLAIHWKYGYGAICLLCAAIALLLLWLCKKKRFL